MWRPLHTMWNTAVLLFVALLWPWWDFNLGSGRFLFMHFQRGCWNMGCRWGRTSLCLYMGVDWLAIFWWILMSGGGKILPKLLASSVRKLESLAAEIRMFAIEVPPMTCSLKLDMVHLFPCARWPARVFREHLLWGKDLWYACRCQSKGEHLEFPKLSPDLFAGALIYFGDSFSKALDCKSRFFLHSRRSRALNLFTGSTLSGEDCVLLRGISYIK